MRDFVHRSFGWNMSGLVPAFGDMSRYPFWVGFSILFLAGWVVILAVTFLTRPEPMELLREFYIKVRPPGLWGPVAATVERGVRVEIKSEAWRNVKAGAWGVGFCFAMTMSLFCLVAGQIRNGIVAAAAAAVTAFFFRRGVLAAAERKTDNVAAINIVAE